MNKKTADPTPLFAIKKVIPAYEPQAWRAEGCERCQHCLLVRQQTWPQIEAKFREKTNG